MAHDDPTAGKIITAEWSIRNSVFGTYTPALTASIVNPNLGTTGTAVGRWHRTGHLITGWAEFDFAGTGVLAGSGSYQINLPFPFDASFNPTGTTQGPIVGIGRLRDESTAANRQNVAVSIFAAPDIVLMRQAGSTFVTDSDPFIWATGDRININFSYVADGASLP